MPRVVLKKPPKPPEYEKLVRRLAQELTAPGSESQPLILEREIEPTNSLHVHVIWDRWTNFPDEFRSDVILDAYAAAQGASVADRISLASGVTPTEALVLGLLPYKVVSTRKRHEPRPPAAKYQKAIEAEAKNAVFKEESGELRYPDLEHAEEARNRLTKALPGSEWSVVQEVMYEG